MADRTEVVQLRRGPYELEVCPGQGGCITGFRHRGRDLLRPATPRYFADGDPQEASSFPMVPFSNRIADARFDFLGQTHQLARNAPPEPHAIHGDGWQNPWAVAEATRSRVVLDFAHRSAGTPLDYRARQTLALDGRGLAVTVEIANAGPRPMPAGLGLHPYFIRSEGVTLTARLDHVWLPGERKIPQQRAALTAGWDFARGLRLGPLDLDHCFGGWDGAAQIRWPETDLTLAIAAEPLFGHLVVYVPPGQDFFCVEPVSHANDGFNLLDRGVAGTGVRILAPGERLAGVVRLSVA
jgi:aldose 1-epimerase